jgi:hypothetical protein
MLRRAKNPLLAVLPERQASAYKKVGIGEAGYERALVKARRKNTPIK